MADPVRFNPGLFDDEYTPPSSLGSPVIFSPGLFDDDEEEEERNFFVNGLAGFGERGSAIVSNLVQGIGTLAEAGEEALYDLTGINPYIRFEPDGISFELYAKPEETASLLGGFGESIEQDLDFQNQRRFTWEDYKDDPLNVKKLAGYVFESGVHSLPDMIAAVAAFPAYFLSRSQEIGEQRAENKGLDQIRLQELAEGAATALPVALLERIGAKGILDTAGKGFIKGTGVGLGKEATTEFLQEQIEYAGETLGTPVPWDAATSLDRGLAGAVAGGGIGAAGGAVSGTLRTPQVDVFGGREPSQIQIDLQARIDRLNQELELGQIAPYSAEVQRQEIQELARQASIRFPTFEFNLSGLSDPISQAARAGAEEARAAGGDALDQAANAAARTNQVAGASRTPFTDQLNREMEEAGRRQAAERQAAQEAEQQSSIGGLGGVEVQIPNVPDTTPTVDLIGSLRNTLNRAIIAARREQRALSETDSVRLDEQGRPFNEDYAQLEDDIARLQFGLTRLQEAQEYQSQGNLAPIPTILSQVRDIASTPILSAESGRRRAFEYQNVLEGELLPRIDETISQLEQSGIPVTRTTPALGAPADFEVSQEGVARRPRSTTQEPDLPPVRARDDLLENQNIIYGQEPDEPTAQDVAESDFVVGPSGETEIRDPAMAAEARTVLGEQLAERVDPGVPLLEQDVEERPSTLTLRKKNGQPYPTRQSAAAALVGVKRQNLEYNWNVIEDGEGFALEGRLPEGLPTPIREVMQPGVGGIVQTREEEAIRRSQEEDIAAGRVPDEQEIEPVPEDYRPEEAPRSEAEIEADIAAINKLIRAINRGTSRGSYNLDTDLFSAIKMMGGINIADARSEDFVVSGSTVPSGLFKRDGRTFDEIAELMREAGYFKPAGESYDAQVAGVNEAIDAIRQALFQWNENRDLTYLEAGQPGRKAQEREGLRNQLDELMAELRESETYSDGVVPLTPEEERFEAESNRDYQPMPASELQYLAGNEYIVGEAKSGLAENARSSRPNFIRTVTDRQTNEIIGVIESLPNTSVARYNDEDGAFDVFKGEISGTEIVDDKIHERRAVQALIKRDRAIKRGETPPASEFNQETTRQGLDRLRERRRRERGGSRFMSGRRRDILNTYTEEELRELANTDTEAAERIAQIDRERELFDLEPTEGTISGTADPLQTDRGQGSLFQESRTARMAAIRRRMDAAMERSGDRLQPRSRRSIERMRARRPREDAVERSRQETTRRFEQNERELAEAFDLPFPVREFINNNRLQEVIDGVVGDNQAARNNIIVVDRFSELPQEVQQDAQAQGLESVTAATQGGKVYLVRQNIVDQTHAERAILHESTHVGIEKMYADEGVERALNRMYVAMGGKSGFNRLVTKLGLDDRIEPYRAGLEKSNYSGAARNRILVDELLANVGEQGSKTFKLRVQEAIGAIRAWLRKNGFAKLSELGVTDIAFASRQARERFATDQSGTVASRDASAARFTGEGRTRAPRDDLGFFSGIEEIIYTQGNKLFKVSKKNPAGLARGDQILSFLKSKGMKPDEARFSRIEQFLEPETRYSRQQILDYMEETGRPQYTEYQAIAEYELQDSLLNLGAITNEKLFSMRVIVDEDLIQNNIDEAMNGDEEYLIETAAQNLIQKFGSDSEDGQALDSLNNIPDEINGEPVSYLAQYEARSQLISELSPDLTEKLRAEVESLARMQEAQTPFQEYSISEDVKQAVKEAGQQTENEMTSLASIKVSGNEDYGWTITATAMRRNQNDEMERRQVLNENESELSEAFMLARDFIEENDLMMAAREQGSAKFREYFDDNLDKETNWDEYREFTLEVGNNVWGEYEGGHFDVNTLYDVITTDRKFDRPAAQEDSIRINTAMLDGPLTQNEYLEGTALFVEEAQSDWASTVRKQDLDISRLDPDFRERVSGFKDDLESAQIDRDIIDTELKVVRKRIESFDDYQNSERADSGPLGAVPRGVRSVQENPRQTIIDDDGMLSIDTYDLAMIMSELDPMLTQRGKSALFRLTQGSVRYEPGPQTKSLSKTISDGDFGGLPRVRERTRVALREMFESGNIINFAPGIAGPENLNRRMDIFERYDLPIGDSRSILRYGPLKERVLGYTEYQARSSFENDLDPLQPPNNPERAAYTPRQDELASALFEYAALLNEQSDNIDALDRSQSRVDATSAIRMDAYVTPRPPIPGDKYIRLAAQRSFATAAEEQKDYLVVTSSNRPGMRWGRDYTAIYDQKWRREIEKVAGAKAVPVTIRGKVADKELAVVDQAMAALKITKVEKEAYMGEDGFETRMGGLRDEWRVEFELPNIELGLNADKLPAGEQDGIPTRRTGSTRVMGSRGVTNRQGAIKEAKLALRNRLMSEMAIAGWAVPITEEAVEKQSSEGISLFMAGPSDFSKQNKTIRDKDVGRVQKILSQARRQLAPGGLLPKAVFDEKIDRDNQLATVEFDTVYYVNVLEKAVKKTMGKAFRNLSAGDLARINDSLTGKMDETLPKEVQDAVIGMRLSIDGLSQNYISILDKELSDLVRQFNGPQRELLDAYIQAKEIDTDTRAGRDEAAALLDEAKARFKGAAEEAGVSGDLRQPIQDIQKAMSQIGLLKIIRGNVGQYVNRSYRAFDDPAWNEKVPDQVLADARSYLRNRLEQAGVDPENIPNRVEVIVNDILKEGTAYGSMEAFIKESTLGAKDLSILQKRKEIAPEIRALLGEYDDARINYAKTTAKMARLIYNTRFLEKVKQIGMGNFLFTEENRPPNMTQLATENSKVLEPLNGLYAPRDIAQAFKDFGGMDDWIGFPEQIIRLNGMIKYGKTVAAPTTQFRNFMSASFFALANGHFDLTKTAKSISVMREYFTRDGDKGRLAYLRKLKQLGVVYDTPFAGEMAKLLEESKLLDIESREGGAIKGTVRGLAQFAQRMYQFGDDFWKIVGYENEKQNLVSTGMSEAEAEVEAARRVRDTYPTYSLVGNFVNQLRRFPLAGTFVSFPAEIIRTRYNQLKIAAEDLADPNRRVLGARRLAGLSIAAAIPYALQSLSKEMFDVSDDEEEAIRLMAPYWSENSNFMFMGRDKNGNLKYLDTSFLDPYNFFSRPINAVMRERPWEESFLSAAKELIRPFFGADILAESMFEAAKNEKATGGRVYNEGDSIERQSLDIVKHIAKDVQPGVFGNIQRTRKALNEPYTTYGKVYTLEDEAYAFFGFRTTTFDPRSALSFRIREIRDLRNEASSALTKVVRDPNLYGEEGIEEAVERTLQMRERAYREAISLINASKAAGLDEEQVFLELKGAGFGKLDRAFLLKGQIPPLLLGKYSIRNSLITALRVLGPVKAQQLAERYQITLEMLESSQEFEIKPAE